MVIQLLLFALALKNYRLNKRNGLKAFVQDSCAQERCKQVDVHLHMICCKLTNDQLQSIFDNGKTRKWLSNYSWKCEKVLKEFMIKSLKWKNIYKKIGLHGFTLDCKVNIF
jgi:hypothetical protein